MLVNQKNQALNGNLPNQEYQLLLLGVEELLEHTRWLEFDPGLGYLSKNGHYPPPRPAFVSKLLNHLQASPEAAVHILSQSFVVSSRHAGLNPLPAQKGKLILLDGRSRVMALDQWVSLEGVVPEQLRNVSMPVIIFPKLSWERELELFISLHTREAEVRTDIAKALYGWAAAKKLNHKSTPEEVWVAARQVVINTMRKNRTSPLRGFLAAPHEKLAKKQKPGTDLAEKPYLNKTESYLISVEPVFNYISSTPSMWQPLRAKYTGEKLAQEVGRAVARVQLAFWRAVEEHLPMLFSRAGDFIALQDGGMRVLNPLCMYLMDMLRRENKLWSQKNFSILLGLSTHFQKVTMWYRDPTLGDGGKCGGEKGAYYLLTKRILPEIRERKHEVLAQL